MPSLPRRLACVPLQSQAAPTSCAPIDGAPVDAPTGAPTDAPTAYTARSLAPPRPPPPHTSAAVRSPMPTWPCPPPLHTQGAAAATQDGAGGPATYRDSPAIPSPLLSTSLHFSVPILATPPLPPLSSLPLTPHQPVQLHGTVQPRRHHNVPPHRHRHHRHARGSHRGDQLAAARACGWVRENVAGGGGGEAACVRVCMCMCMCVYVCVCVCGGRGSEEGRRGKGCARTRAQQINSHLRGNEGLRGERWQGGVREEWVGPFPPGGTR